MREFPTCCCPKEVGLLLAYGTENPNRTGGMKHFGESKTEHDSFVMIFALHHTGRAVRSRLEGCEFKTVRVTLNLLLLNM